MRSRVLLLALLVAAPATVTTGTHASAQTYGPACTAGYSAELLATGDMRVLRIVGPQPFVGEVVLFGAARRYHVALDASTADAPAFGFTPRIATQIVGLRAPEHVQAASFRPPGATCDLNAVASPPGLAYGTFAATRQLDAVDDGALPPAACDAPFRAPELTAAAAPSMPAMAQQQGITGRVLVLVGLDATGRVTSARAYQTPSPILNNAAIVAARASSFRPAILRCEAAPSTYALTVDFSRQ